MTAGQPQRSHLPLRILDDHEVWHEQALCARTDPELFFPLKGTNTAAAKQICRRCRVTIQCLEYARRHNEPYGIWGGLTATERRSNRRGRL